MEYLGVHQLTGFKIKTIKGRRPTQYGSNKLVRRKKEFEAEYILFTDKKTVLQFEEQDYYTHHDCSGTAREIQIFQCKDMWKRIFENEWEYPTADTGICW